MQFSRLFSLALLAAATTAYAQQITGTIVGSVQDASGSAIQGATVEVTNTDRNAVVRTTVTGSEGNYTASLLPVGNYSVAVEAKGFKKSVKSAIGLNVNDVLTVNFNLEVGDVQQEVTVEANAPQVDLQSSTAQSLISSDQISELALNSRNYEQLVALMPGVTYTGTADQIFFGVTNPITGLSNQVSFSINGARTSQNLWLVDGADNLDRGANLTLLNYPSVDAIQEVRVLRGQYSAEYGRNAGGMVSVITKSGTNQFKGDVYEFFRNNVLAANPWFNNANRVNVGPDGKAQVAPLRYNNFGYTIGGPVWVPKVYNGKNKTFFFFSEEFRRIITYTAVQGLAPNANEKKGIFSTPVCVQLNTANGTCNLTSTTVTNIDPLAAAYIKDIFNQVPDAPPGGHTINASYRNISNFRQELIRIDHVFSPKWALAGRYTQDAVPTIEPRGIFTGAALPGVSNTSTNSPGKNFIVRVTGSITPSLVNEAGYSYSYGAVLSDPTGLDASVNSPDIKPNLPYPVTLGRVPTLSFSGALSTVTGYGPYRDYNRNHNWFDNITKITGKHSIRGGVTIIRYNKQENAAGNNVGSFTFPTTATPTGTSTAAQSWAYFLTGQASNFTQVARDITPSIRVNQAEMYVQDDYRVNRNLTLNIGVRYSIFRQPFDAFHYLNNFDPNFYDPAKAPQITAAGNFVPGTGDPLNGFIINGKNSPFGDKVTNENWKNWAPRLGFAWDPFKDGKTAIRGGYGIAFDSPQVGNTYEYPVLFNPPSVQSVSINNTSLSNPAGGTLVVGTAPPNIYGIALPFKSPYIEQWSFDVQREFPHQYILDVGYFGSKGTHLIGEPDINQVPIGAAVAAGITDANTPITRTTEPRLNAIRPYKGYGAINVIESEFNSAYHGLQVGMNKRYARGFLGVSYTWSKLLTDNGGSDVGAPEYTYNRRLDYGRSAYDRRQVFTANWNYQLPYFANHNALVRSVAGGWQYSGILSVATGLPFNASDTTLGTDPGGIGVIASAYAGPRADQLCDPNSNAPRNILQWFNTSCFADVPKGQVRIGNAGRNTINGPGYQKWDMSLMKNFKFNENVRLQFRAEAFNVFNHTNWASIASTLGASNFGNITAARDPRIMQLALKLYY